jgi:hypothetical protein
MQKVEFDWSGVVEAAARLGQAINTLLDAMTEFFCRVVKCIIERIRRAIQALQQRHASPRIYHLAHHSKKHRTRKKNLARIWKPILKILKE